MISGHGDDRYQYAQTLRADFSSNVWFGGTPPELISHLQQNLHLIGNYPEAALAGILNCRFGGPNVYNGVLVEKPYIGKTARHFTKNDFYKTYLVNIFTCLIMIGLICYFCFL